ncbi:MAG: orotate phosphoribosyltransferase [Bacteroidia bacterium]|nr:orotate phosphoribosyltransferase [Bacteroidia bacterium]MDW8158934.1 orotate phosphoribosyltransferase [Bacteroidia bacterium]
MKTQPEASLKLADLFLRNKVFDYNLEVPFTWSSGILAPVYCDNRKNLSYPDTRNFIVELLTTKAKQFFSKSEIIAGVATGGIPYGVLLADRLQLPFIYVRPEPKKHGLKLSIEGNLIPSAHVLVVEDLVSTGKSSLAAIRTLREQGVKADSLLSIFSYEFEATQEKFLQENIHHEYLCNLDMVLAQALENNFIDSFTYTQLIEWKKSYRTEKFFYA